MLDPALELGEIVRVCARDLVVFVSEEIFEVGFRFDVDNFFKPLGYEKLEAAEAEDHIFALGQVLRFEVPLKDIVKPWPELLKIVQVQDYVQLRYFIRFGEDFFQNLEVHFHVERVSHEAYEMSRFDKLLPVCDAQVVVVVVVLEGNLQLADFIVDLFFQEDNALFQGVQLIRWHIDHAFGRHDVKHLDQIVDQVGDEINPENQLVELCHTLGQIRFLLSCHQELEGEPFIRSQEAEIIRGRLAGLEEIHLNFLDIGRGFVLEDVVNEVLVEIEVPAAVTQVLLDQLRARDLDEAPSSLFVKLKEPREEFLEFGAQLIGHSWPAHVFPEVQVD